MTNVCSVKFSFLVVFLLSVALNNRQMCDYYADISKIFTVVKNFGVGWKVFEGKSLILTTAAFI